jgi:hypothetical protein
MAQVHITPRSLVIRQRVMTRAVTVALAVQVGTAAAAAAARFPSDGAIASMLRLLGARKGSEFGEQAAATAAVAVDIAWVLAALSYHSDAHQNAIRLGGGIPLLVSLLEGPAQVTHARSHPLLPYGVKSADCTISMKSGGGG